MQLIHDILVRIRTRGSLPLTYGSGFCFFQWLTRCQQKPSFFPKFLSYCFLKVRYLHHAVFKDKKSKRSHKIAEIKVFLTSFACRWKDYGSAYLGGLKTYGSGSTTLANRFFLTLERSADSPVPAPLHALVRAQPLTKLWSTEHRHLPIITLFTLIRLVHW